MFSGENAKHDFCKWLFSPSHKDFTVFVHNAKAYDNYSLLEYLIDNSFWLEIIYNGSEIMYTHVQRGLNIRMLDDVYFLPMKLAKLPEAFGFKELKKGFFSSQIQL